VTCSAGRSPQAAARSWRRRWLIALVRPLRDPAVWLPFLLLPVVIVTLEPTGLDLAFQDWIWSGLGGGHWPLNPQAFWPRLVFYRVPKTAVLLLGIAAAIGGLASYWQPRIRAWRRPLLFLVLSLALVPATAGFLKSITDVHCPSQLTRYGGTEPYDGPAAQLLASVETTTRGRCFPAGHAAGGFALLAFGWLASTRRRRLAGWTFGFAMGVVMGGYQMARGVHFLSHTLTTLLLALTILGYLDRAILRPAVSGQTVR
jgi:membrane-associated PAP2 superfamily phosphatase